jgi:hypothetical protein
MPFGMVTIWKNYNSIFTDSLFVQCNISKGIDTSMTKKNLFVRTFYHVPVKRKMGNNARRKRELQ